MGLTKEDVREVINVYIKAWTEQDPDLIVTIFTPGAIYHERVMKDVTIAGREAIRDYWQSKVVGAQANITCRLLNLYLDGYYAGAEDARLAADKAVSSMRFAAMDKAKWEIDR